VTMGRSTHCDVAIIGGGIAGLTSAALLSKAGLHVELFETESQAGGCLASFHRKGFTFDASLEWLNQCRPGGFLARIHQAIGNDGPRYVPLQRIHRYKNTGHNYLLTSNPLELRDHLIRDFPHESKGIQKLFRDAERLGHHMLFLDNRMRSVKTMSLRELLHHGLAMTRWVWPIRQVVSTPAARGLTRYFKTRELLNLFHSDGTMMSVLVPLGFAFTGDFQKPPEGGCAALVNWLCRKITENGGRISLNQRVQEVLVNASKEATGIRLATGDTVHARYVIAACDVEKLFTTMLPPASVPARILKRLRHADLYYSSFSIYLGLDCPPASLGLDESLVRLTEDSIPLEDRVNGEARSTLISVLAPSLRDSSLAPPGKGTLLIQCPAYLSHHNHWETGPGLERGNAYRRYKQEFTDTILDRVERLLIPGLRRHIEVMEVATPVTFHRYTGNRDGSIMGHKPTRKNIHARLANLTTPVKRLLLGGQWAEYGGGVPMATKAAVNSSLMILQEMRPPAFTALKKGVDGTGFTPLTIGIPRALYYFYYPSLFETFFAQLGHTPVLSGASTRHTVEQAVLISESEHCLPLKLLDAHLAELAGKVDRLFVPRLLSGLKGHIACPKLSALPDVAQAQFGDSVRILSLDINENSIPLRDSLLELGRSLGAEEALTCIAADTALAALAEVRRQPVRKPGSTRKRLLVISHPYNLHDDYISGPILATLKRLDVDVDLMPFDGEEIPVSNIKWDTCGKMNHHLKTLDPDECAAVIQLTSFNCGCDSIVMEFNREILKTKGIPTMTLVVDEHAAQAGTDTRLEAFVDSTRW
jgi:prolycopene isomerase